MTSLGFFSEEELELVSNIGFIIAPSERLGEGFTVQVIDGLRTWSCATKFGQIMVKGAPASFSGAYTLSPRFVRGADHLANLGDPVEITIDDDMACASNDMGKELMPMARTATLVESLDGDNITTVEISQMSLYYMLNWGSSDPAAYVSEEDMSKVPCVSVFKVEPNMLGIDSSFDEVGCNRMSTFQFATVSGPTGEFAVDRVMIRRISSFLLLPGNLPMTVSFDLAKGTVVQFAAANWKIMLNRMNTGAGRYHEDVLEALRTANLDFVEGDDASICVDHEGQVIVLDLLDGRWPIVRCTIELVSDVERTLDLLKEIDMQNEGRVNTKYFMRGDTVIACVDVRCDGLEHLQQELMSLVADSDLLGSYLASLGIVGDELSLI